MKALEFIWRALGSLGLSLWLFGALLAMMIVGAVQMPAMPEYGDMSSVRLMDWLARSPARATWWIWLSMAVLALLALNTLACSAESLLKKRGGRHWALVVSPQIMHLGFLFMLAGHLASSLGAFHGVATVRQGQSLVLPDGTVMRFTSIHASMAPAGYPTGWRADISYFDAEGNRIMEDFSAPNRPSFMRGYFGGYGVYVKNAMPGVARIEASREPGAPWALMGGALFTLGTVMLIYLKITREQ